MFTSTSEAVAAALDPSDFAQAPPLARKPARSPREEAALAEVLRHPGIWRRGTAARATVEAQPTGLPELDARLPGGGWPRGALSEILIEQDGIGECSLLLPALAAITQAKQRVVFVAPPYIPYAPALAAAGLDLPRVVHIEASSADTHWTAEQCLRAGCCGAVLSWMPATDYQKLRRLQLAAETGGAIGFVFRPLAAAKETSPAALRVEVTMSNGLPKIDILKCRGHAGETTQAVRLRG
jgi:hypothetical protein